MELEDAVSKAPRGFAEEVRAAAERGQVGRLGLLGLEAGEYGWKREGLGRVEAGLAGIGGEGAGRLARQLGFVVGEAGDTGVHAIVFTGHMIDAVGRERERFPARAEGAGRDAIRNAVVKLESGRLAVGLAGGASGGDLLFHEVCAELGVETRLLLTLPERDFVEASVAPAGMGWVRRFEALVARLGAARVEVLGEGLALPGWMGERGEYDVWQRTNLWLLEEAVALAPTRTLLALWDGAVGDGPGGTQHMVEAATRFGFEVAPPILTSTLFD